uniref:Uncharacterized protein n=1 Tax=Rhizophora mucronata TaxID=61149 RepID=A0A2P2ISI1_RHIMU
MYNNLMCRGFFDNEVNLPVEKLISLEP